jgi:protein gp37
MDARFNRDPSVIGKTSNFDLPLKKTRNGEYKLKPDDIIFTCLSSDFFLEEADEWRIEAWKMIRLRRDLHFYIITKRIERFRVSLPEDWNGGYDNVTICVTCENQEMADLRMPILLELPIRHKSVICEPLLGKIDLSSSLDESIEEVTVGGESGSEARTCQYDWVLDIRSQCIAKNISFNFKQTGSRFVKNNRLYRIERKDQLPLAAKAGINYTTKR